MYCGSKINKEKNQEPIKETNMHCQHHICCFLMGVKCNALGNLTCMLNWILFHVLLE